MIERLVLFGATGDLTGRYLLPALARLVAAGALPAGFEVVGAARDDLGDEDFRRLAGERLDAHAPEVADDVRAALLGALRYRRVDLDDPDRVAAVVGGDDRPVAVYLALPPSTYATVVTTLARVGLPAGSRLVVEKPFGVDLADARALNELVTRVPGVDGEEGVFRVDHVLGLPALHNLEGLRRSNRVLEQLWSSEHIEQVEVLWDETLGLEGRAGYYDDAGALLDVVQNHLIQILAVLAMEPPGDGGADRRDRRADVLRSVRIPTVEEAARRSVRARYTAGTLAPPPEGAGTAVPSYVDEDGVDPARGTETFAEIVLELDSPRWAGTRVVLRTAKALQRRHKGVVLRFRPATAAAAGPDGTPPPGDELHIGLDGPHDVALHLIGAAPGPPARPVPVVLTAAPPPEELPAYGHVLLDVLTGGTALSVRGDEAERAWEIVTPFLEAWAEDLVPLQDYPAGSTGPAGRAHDAGARGS